MFDARPYQLEAVDAVELNWRDVHARGCLVAPTGAGKTVMAEMLIRRARELNRRVLFLAHRRELIKQSASRFESIAAVGTVMATEKLDADARIQVASIQTLLKRDFWPEADIVILDECHHYASDEWKVVTDHYSGALVVGLTATPERQDGRTLGDMFRWLVVAAHYQQLVADGFLTKCRAYQPPSVMKSDLAKDPLKAYKLLGQGLSTFGFGRDVKTCKRYTQQFKAAGISCATVDYATSKTERDYVLRLFGEGRIKVVWSVAALTEGVDVPRAKCCILARQFQHVGGYLQAAGRVLRPWESEEAILIDLCGSTLIHGLPTEDRVYSLDGKGIQRTSLAPLRNCPKCGATILSAYTDCPECGHHFKAAEKRQPKIWDLELKEVYSGESTPIEAKLKEWKRLLAWSEQRSLSVSIALREYHKLFADDPDMSLVGADRKRAEFDALTKTAEERGYKKAWPLIRFKQIFGHNPPSNWIKRNTRPQTIERIIDELAAERFGT